MLPSPRVLAGLVVLTFSAYCGILTCIVPVTLILPMISKRLAYRMNDQIMRKWFQLTELVLTGIFGIRMRTFGEKLTSDRFLMLANHRCRLDWFFTMALGENSYQMKYSMKEPLRHVPIFGWAMQFNFFIFLQRNIALDRDRIARVLRTILEMGSGRSFRMFFFPEGTDLSLTNKKRNLEFALKTSKKPTEHVLLPRITGFKEILKTLHKNKQLPDVIYDLTIGYPKGIAQTEMDLLFGRYPEEVHFYFRSYEYKKLSFIDNAQTLNLDEEEAGKWLEGIWYEKDQLLAEINAGGNFKDEYQISDAGYDPLTGRPKQKGLVAILFWVVVVTTFCVLFSQSTVFRFYALLASAAFTLVDVYFPDGISGLYSTIYGIKHEL